MRTLLLLVFIFTRNNSESAAERYCRDGMRSTLVSKSPTVLELCFDSYPDSYYFSGNLHADVRDAADACADIIGTPREESLLVENASVGAVIVAQRWMWKFVEQVR